ncbi:hypothetical protein [Pectobacterium sp. B2J-2]|uniref:hypothetical protein n=1 Tax=Pectobacterium sp. B2J-2 TaxID=3385372 RepID=UPI0038FC7DE0
MKTKVTMTKMAFVEETDKEWELMWTALGQHAMNRELPDPTVADNFGEVWQYMESREVRYLFFFKRYYHFFRHRMHPRPAMFGRQCIKILASRGFNPTNVVLVRQDGSSTRIVPSEV